MNVDKIFILSIAKKSIEMNLSKSQKRLQNKSNKLKNMDLNQTTQRARAMQRVRVSCEAEELNRWESRLNIVNTWIEEEKR